MSRRETFRQLVLDVLKKYEGRDTHIGVIYAGVKLKRPDLCDDAEPCRYCGSSGSEPAWKHDVRWALEDLKNARQVAPGGFKGMWHER